MAIAHLISSLSTVERSRSLIDSHPVRVVYPTSSKSNAVTISAIRVRLTYRSPGPSLFQDTPHYLMPSLLDGQGRRMETEECDRLILAIASARSWLDGLVKGTIADLASLPPATSALSGLLA
jgi:hypothetical protein